MNEQLKFSWGHIIAFLAIIVLSYITFVGVTYKTNGDFTHATTIMFLVDIILFMIFIGAQMLKATTRKFARRIWIERVCVFGSPIVFFLSMFPYYHFSTVHSRNDEIVKNFTDAISASKQMFSDYQLYSDERISKYEHLLTRVINNYSIHPDEFSSCGFSVGKEKIQKANMVKALRLQLLSENYDSLKNEATTWIESASKGASTWNVFLLGNTKQIKSAIHMWNSQLSDFAEHIMNNEEFNGYNEVVRFREVSPSLSSVDEGLDGLTSKFVDSDFPPFGSIIGSIALYFALLFPYILQDRHTKSQYRLLGMEKGAIRSASTIIIDASRQKREETHIIVEDMYETEPQSSSSSNPDNDDDYASFTL